MFRHLKIWFPLVLFLAIIGIPVSAQVRKHDVLILKDSTRIEAFVTEVGESELRYKKRTDPDGPVFVIKKSELEAVEYGNGERETFGKPSSEVYFEPEAAEKPVVYNAPAAKSKFEKLMYSWNESELRAAHPYFKRKSKSGFVNGIVFSSIGLIGIGVGSALIESNVNSASVIVNEAGFRTGVSLMLGGLVVGATLGTIGFVNGGRNASKVKKIARELRRRRIPLTGFKIAPGYHPGNQYGFVTMHASF